MREASVTSNEVISGVPTNVITGALGAGKTTLIKALLATKPSNERWAVLVNEFGEVGIDSALMHGSKADSKDGIYVRQVPGGCMCCTSGLPMQIALNQLLAQAKPHRLLIEPTGLGHPAEVLETLCEPHYQGVLDIKATLTLIDARKLTSAKWRDHATFQEQVHIADHLVVTKGDLYRPEDFDNLNVYRAGLGVMDIPLSHADHGNIDLALLESPSRFNLPAEKTEVHSHDHDHDHDHGHSHAHGESEATELALPPEQDWLQVENSGQGFYSCGWIFSSRMVFDYKLLFQTIQKLNVERFKGVVNTNQGTKGFNLADGKLSVEPIETYQDSRIEIIADSEQGLKRAADRIKSALSLN